MPIRSTNIRCRPTNMLSIALLLQLVLLVFATANEDSNNRNDIHEQHSHLTPQQYGHNRNGLRARKKSSSKKSNNATLSDGRRRRKPGRGPPRNNGNRDDDVAKRKKKKKKNKVKKNKKKNNKNGGGGNNKQKNGGNDKPNRKPSSSSGSSGGSSPSSNGNGKDSSSSSSTSQTLAILSSFSKEIDTKLFLYETPTLDKVPSTVYKSSGLAKGLEVMNTQGVAGMYFYLGDGGSRGYQYGLTNIAAFLAQSMKETIKYNACSENNWDLYGDSGYPLSNSCGQLGQSYQDYKCPKGEEHMECDVDPNMDIVAVTNAKWYGAPAPFFCEPKKKSGGFTGKWDYGKMCNLGWVDPPLTCDDYEGQKAGGFDNEKPVANRNGRTDVEGCCWWGRGVIQTTGICNFGKLNYYLGARAQKEGRKTPYGDVDFCKDPEIICSSKKYSELKWIAGMFYWMESVQKYDVGNWNYMTELRKFVDGGFKDRSFIDSVSGIVNRGCHNPPCGTGAVDGGQERYGNFIKVLSTFKLIDTPKEEKTGRK